MLTDSALHDAWRALREVVGNELGEGWRTIPFEGTSGCRLMAGHRLVNGEEAVLFGFPPAARGAAGSAVLPGARGFHVEIVRETIPGEARAWFALVRQPAASPTMFARMATDVVAALGGVPSRGESLFRVFTERIRAWQAFMESGRDAMLGPQAEIGLVGELIFLRQILDAGVAGGVAVEGWRGPLDGMHDFVLGEGAVEVKATTTTGEFPATVGSLGQLDDSQVRPLFLAGVRLVLGASGRTLPEIAAEVENSLTDDAVARARFGDLVLHAGLHDSVRERYVRRFVAVRTVVFRVADGFPRLVRSNVMRAVRSVRYELDLDLVPVPETELGAALRELQVI